MSAAPSAHSATPAKKSVWEQVPKPVKYGIYAFGGIILLVISFSTLNWYHHLPPKPVSKSNDSDTETRSVPHTTTIVMSDFLYGVNSRDTVITEEITLDQNVPYSEVTNMDPVFCDGTPVESQGKWPSGYKRYRTIRPQNGSAKLFMRKP